MSARLNKLLADRGIAARRKCDRLIAEGHVRVNGEVVTEPGTRVDELRDRVTVDGRPLAGPSKLVYYVLNKPVGVLTTLDDPEGRRTVRDLLPRGPRLFPVGRLDADTSGLLVLTNDGDLAHHLMHPRYGVEKVYRVRLQGEPNERQLARLRSGVRFDEGLVSAPARVRRIDPGFDAIMIELAIHEGRQRQVRKMCEAVGLVVTGLHRVAYGPVRLGPLARGMFRELSDQEVARLKSASARPVPRSPREERASRAAGPRRRSAPPPRSERDSERRVPSSGRARPVHDPDAGGADLDETFVSGGGPLESFDDEPPAAWPARASDRRGDAGWDAEPARDAERPAPSGNRTRRDPRGDRRPRTPRVSGAPERARRRTDERPRRASANERSNPRRRGEAPGVGREQRPSRWQKPSGRITQPKARNGPGRSTRRAGGGADPGRPRSRRSTADSQKNRGKRFRRGG